MGLPKQLRRHVSKTYRSGLEDKVGLQLKTLDPKATYETRKIGYRVEEDRTYTPDWNLTNGVIVETKGLFNSDDRKKHMLVKAQHPELDIRFVFTNSRSKLYKGSKTTYGDWCTKNGFIYSDKVIPDEWVNN